MLLLITSSFSLGSPALVGLFPAQLSLRRFQSVSGNGLVLIALNSIAFILFTPPRYEAPWRTIRCIIPTARPRHLVKTPRTPTERHNIPILLPPTLLEAPRLNPGLTMDHLLLISGPLPHTALRPSNHHNNSTGNHQQVLPRALSLSRMLDHKHQWQHPQPMLVWPDCRRR